MYCVYMWLLGTALSLRVVPGEQHAQLLAVPQILDIRTEDDKEGFGVWKMNVEWKDGFTDASQPERAAYDLEIFQSERRRLVHAETIEVIPDANGTYHWSWTSPIPLQCTSHSIHLRHRDLDHNNTSEWSSEHTLKGKDMYMVYPQNHKALVNESIVFCCVLKADQVKGFRSANFTIQISSRTFITEPVRYPRRTPPHGVDITCEDTGATFYTGYPPDVYNLTCETRDLRSVECHWSNGSKNGFVGGTSKMSYHINGRDCSSEKCVLDQSADNGVTEWTLIAKNILGNKTLTDKADPKHRVRLVAPDQARTSFVGERNATLEWKWEILRYSLFPMTCQVQLNGLVFNETFNGSGLQSVLLNHLHTSTEYEAQVRCGSQEHFYTWGDWSKPITFRTKPDGSKAADVWMQVVSGQTSIVWKPFSPDYDITSFELVLGSSTEHVTILPKESCYKVDPESIEMHQTISVTAKSSDWASPPSSITFSSMSDGDVNITAIKASNKGFQLNWNPNPISTCGYIVDWFPSYRAEPCRIEWIKLSSSVSSALIKSEFEDGVSYTLSLYACTSGTPKLLQRKEGYVKELAPSGCVQNLLAEQQGSNVYLSWDDVPKMEQRGFIWAYNVSYCYGNGDKNKWQLITDPSSRGHYFSLYPDTYMFSVKALTSRGEGPAAEYTVAVNPLTQKIIIIIISILAAASCSLAILYRKRKWLKSVLYPDVPRPGISAEWISKGLHQGQLIDKLLLAEKEVLKLCYPEPPSQLPPDPQKEDKEAQPVYNPNSKDSPWSETWEKIRQHHVLNPITPIAVDFSYMEVPCAAVQNPTYNISLEHPPRTSPANEVTSDYIPQKQNVNAT